MFIKESGVRPLDYLDLLTRLLTRVLQCNKMSCPNCMTLSCYVCRKVITGYDHFNEVRSVFLFRLFPLRMRTERSRESASPNGQKMRANAYFGIK